MADPRFNLLTDPLLSVTDGDDAPPVALTLPAVLARLGAAQPTEFSALRAHQRAPWHAFLVQIAAIACARGGDERVAVDAATWTARLRALTDGDDAPWSLVVDDLTKPALLQPPVPEKKLATLKNTTEQPDALDVLITAKNHDVKGARMAHAQPEHWLYALVTLQTTEGFLGKGNYGVARMNGGFASRPQVALAPGTGFGARFARDVRVWLDARASLVEAYGYRDDGIALVWCVPWDGSSSLAIQALDPFFVEVCRRVRLSAAGDVITVHGVSTTAARIDAKALLGVTGDVWTPVRLDGAAGKALTVAERGLDYVLRTRLVFAKDYRRAPAQEPGDDDGDAPVFHARALARGQGETNGLHERVVDVPGTFRGWLADPTERDRLAAFAQMRIERVAEFRKRVLRPALIQVVQAAPEPKNAKKDDDRINVFVDRFHASIDDLFFPSLWRDAALPDTADRNAPWDSSIVALGRRALTTALASAPVPSNRRERTVAAAWRVFEGSARKNFPAAYTHSDDRTTEPATTEEAQPTS